MLFASPVGLWLKFAGLSLAIGIAAMIFFLLINRAVYAWGFFGALVAFGAVLLLFGWLYDRRQEQRYADLNE